MLRFLENLPIIGGILEFIRDVIKSPYVKPKQADYDGLHEHTGGFGKFGS